MIESFLSVGTQVLILFLMIGTGFVLGKLHLITHKGVVSMSNLLMYVVSPCILIVVFQRPLETETFHNFWVALLAALVIHGINILVSELVIRDRDPMRKSFFRFSAIFSNCGFMAVPLQTAILGSLGVFYGSAYLLVFTVLTWTLGIQLVKGGKMAFSWRTLLMNPGVIGVVIAMVRTAHDQQRPGRKNPALGAVNAIFKVYVTVIRGTPMMLQLMIWAFVVFKSRQYTLVGIFGLGINSGAYVSEIIRGGLMAVDGGQMEAGRSLGLNYVDTMRFIVVPQAVKAILPSLGNEFIILLKDTSLLSVIGGKELLYFADAIATRTWEQMFPLFGAALIYLVLVMIFTWLLGKLERRLRQGDRR